MLREFREEAALAEGRQSQVRAKLRKVFDEGELFHVGNKQ
jgi:hypothetical protein